MLQKFKKDKLLAIISVLVIALFFIITYFIMESSKTTTAIVLKTDVDAGQIITEDMITEIEIPVGTPQGYLRNTSSVIGYKLKTNVEKGQLIYESNFMSSWTNYSDSEKIPDDYVITSVGIPNAQACGGVITAGDYVDVLAVFPYQSSDSSWTGSEGTAVEVNGTGRSDTGTTVAYILSNVYVLNTNSSLAQAQEGGESSGGESSQAMASGEDEMSYYIFALSYDDCKKLRQVEGVDDVKLWLNICPSQNQDEGCSPLLKQMVGQSYSFLHDAQESVQDKEGNMLVDDYYVTDEDGTMKKYSDYKSGKSKVKTKSKNN